MKTKLISETGHPDQSSKLSQSHDRERHFVVVIVSLLLFTLNLRNLEVYKAAGKCSVVDQTSKCSVVSVIAAALDFPLIYPSVFVVHKRNSKSWISSLYGKVQQLNGVTKKCPEYDQVIEKLKQCLWISNPQGNGNIIYTRVWLMCEWLHKINANTWGSSIACSCCDSKHVSDLKEWSRP